MSSASIFVLAADIGQARAWLSGENEAALFHIPLDRGISIAGRVGAAVALRDALNSAIEQAEALTGGAT